MARYKLLQAAIVEDIQREAGTEVEYDGVPGPHMEPLDAAAKKAVADRDKDKPAAIDTTMRAHPAENIRPGVTKPEEPAHQGPTSPGSGGVPRRG
jgi:hypothetical protein